MRPAANAGADRPHDQKYDVVDDEEAKGGSNSLLSMLSSAVGDMTSITIPIAYLEPTSFLQRLCEAFQYSELLDQAALADDPVRRTALVAAYFVSAHNNNYRTAKPFNPLLGETFEYERVRAAPRASVRGSAHAGVRRRRATTTFGFSASK